MVIIFVLFSSLASLCFAIIALLAGASLTLSFALYITLGIAIPLLIVSRRNATTRKELATRSYDTGMV